MKTSDEPTNLNQSLHHWAKQTILFAMSLQAQDAGHPLNNDSRIAEAYKNADETKLWLWDEANKEAGDDDSKFLLLFTKKVLDWSWNHRNLKAKKM
jgi:hypothetical protein